MSRTCWSVSFSAIALLTYASTSAFGIYVPGHILHVGCGSPWAIRAAQAQSTAATPIMSVLIFASSTLGSSLRAPSFLSLGSSLALHLLSQSECEVFARVVAAADGDDDVLFAVQRIGHRRARLLGRQEDRADLRPGLLVIRAQHRAPPPVRHRRRQRIAG